MNKKLLNLMAQLIVATEKKETQEPQSQPTEYKCSSELFGKPVIIRSRDAGVHFGYLHNHSGNTVTLTNARRMYRWWAKKQMTLSAVAAFGLNLDKELRVQNELERHIIIGVCEIIPASQDCVESFLSVEPYDEQ